MVRNDTRFSNGERGSVLTEFLIVAPLYLLLFGGLLLSNDMVRLKNKIAMVDVFVTMTGTHRFVGEEEAPKITEQVSHVWGDFMPGSVNSPLMIANEYQSSDGHTLSNRWNAVYAGRVDAEYRLPWMINSLLSVQRVVFGDKNYAKHPQVYRMYADPKTGEFPPENECRFHVIQRHWTTKASQKGFNRGADAYKLVGDGILNNVMGDAWLFTKSTLAAEETEGNDSTYKQQLAKYGE